MSNSYLSIYSYIVINCYLQLYKGNTLLKTLIINVLSIKSYT